MEFTKKLPNWAWWAIGIAVIIAVAAIVVATVRNRGPVLPPGLVEKRNAVAKIFDEASRVEDVDIRPLVKLEAQKDYRGAAALMGTALAANASLAGLNESLVTVSAELAKLAVGVEPDPLGAKAVEAFGLLRELAQAEKKFYDDRRRLYETTRDYYAGLAAKKSLPIPENLRAAVEIVSADLERAKNIHQQFSAAMRAFDEAVGGK